MSDSLAFTMIMLKFTPFHGERGYYNKNSAEDHFI